ncbi:hypothetical protein DBR06_SOUSAS13010008, partial [Sousa chinensis]
KLQLQMILRLGFQPTPLEEGGHQHPLEKVAAFLYPPL